MEILYTNCAGLDVHKKMVKICVLTHPSSGQAHKEFRTYLTTTEELLKLSDWLREQECTHIAFEATGVYTPPPMLQIGGGTVRSLCRRNRTDAEDNTDLLLIYLNTFDQSTDNVPTGLCNQRRVAHL